MTRTNCRAIAIALTGLCCLSGNAFAYTVYVSNEKGNSISVIFPASRAVNPSAAAVFINHAFCATSASVSY